MTDHERTETAVLAAIALCVAGAMFLMSSAADRGAAVKEPAREAAAGPSGADAR